MSQVSIDIIKNAAGWTDNSGTFARFYHRNIIAHKGTYANTILDRTIRFMFDWFFVKDY